MQLSEAINKQLKKFDRIVLYKNSNCSRWNCMSIEEEDIIKDFISTAIKEAIIDIMPDEEKEVFNIMPKKTWNGFRKEILNKLK